LRPTLWATPPFKKLKAREAGVLKAEAEGWSVLKGAAGAVLKA
jgi:hypothetical protein